MTIVSEVGGKQAKTFVLIRVNVPNYSVVTFKSNDEDIILDLNDTFALDVERGKVYPICNSVERSYNSSITNLDIKDEIEIENGVYLRRLA